MTLYRDDGIVLRTEKLGDADRVVVLLTQRHGRVRAVAKGARRPESKFGDQLRQFSHVDLVMYRGRSMDVITQAGTVRSYGEKLASKAGKAAVAAAMVDIAERFTPTLRAPATAQFLLLAGGLQGLGGRRPPRLLLDAYLLRSLAVAGWGLPLEDCASHRMPRITCSCPPPVPNLVSPDDRTVGLMRALVKGDWPRARASDARSQLQCSHVAGGYLRYHLECPLLSVQAAYKSLAGR